MIKMEIMKEDVKEDALNWVDQFEETKQWLGRFKIGTTKVRYAKYLMMYVAHTGLNPKQLIELKQNQKNHDSEKVLDRFVAEADIPQSTLRNISIAVKSFYKWNYEDLARACGTVTRTKMKPYRTPTQKDLKTFIVGTNPRDKALILFMSATRIREETITLLNWSHVWKDLFEEPRDPPHIGVMAKELKGKGSKNYADLEQHTFLTPDAKAALLAYKEWREERTGETITPENPLFISAYARSKKKERIGTDLIRKTFERASKRTGLKFSAHDVGRFTQTQLENARIQPNWIKKITGHKIKGEENPYSRPKIEKLREAYESAIPFLTTEIEEVTPIETEQTINELRKQLEVRNHEIEEIKRINQEGLKTMNKVIVDVNKRVDDLTETAEKLKLNREYVIDELKKTVIKELSKRTRKKSKREK